MVARLNDVEAFEFNLPFHTIRIDIFEGCVKRYVNMKDNQTVTMRQLTYAFKEDLSWAALQDEKSLLFNMFL